MKLVMKRIHLTPTDGRFNESVLSNWCCRGTALRLQTSSEVDVVIQSGLLDVGEDHLHPAPTRVRNAWTIVSKTQLTSRRIIGGKGLDRAFVVFMSE